MQLFCLRFICAVKFLLTRFKTLLIVLIIYNEMHYGTKMQLF